MPDFQDFGALWATADPGILTGKIYDKLVTLRHNTRKAPGDSVPDWRIFDPAAEGEAATKDIGAIWERSAKKDETVYLSGNITIAGQKRDVSLWPAKRNTDRSPTWRVMPPRPPKAERLPSAALPSQALPTSAPRGAVDEGLPVETLPQDDFDDEVPF